MAATCAAYWLSPAAGRRHVLLVSTVAMLAYADPISLLVLILMTATVALALHLRDTWSATAPLSACGAIVAVLVAFKLSESMTESAAMIDRVVPLGLSYYSLRCIHLLLESYLGQIPRPHPRDVLGYLFLPATIIAGPIHRYPAFVAGPPSGFDWTNLSEGLERILYGYAKIIVISNYLLSTKFFPWALTGLDQSSGSYAYLDALSHGLTIYFQFSGYSDIAIGFALLIGHRVIENFRWPLFKTNIVEFWRSWHISLTSLCREYVFASVYAATRKAWAGALVTMLAISLWHGITLNYLAWGIYHAVGIVLYQHWSRSRAAAALGRILPIGVSRIIGWFLTFQFVMLGFIWTKENDILSSIEAYLSLFAWLFEHV